MAPPPPLSVAVVSDLHLEARALEVDAVLDPELTADVLCLLGDIGDPSTPAYAAFIAACAARFPTVLLLAGNNEYRNRDPHAPSKHGSASASQHQPEHLHKPRSQRSHTHTFYTIREVSSSAHSNGREPGTSAQGAGAARQHPPHSAAGTGSGGAASSAGGAEADASKPASGNTDGAASSNSGGTVSSSSGAVSSSSGAGGAGGRTMSDTEALIRSVASRHPNVHFLQNGVFESRGVAFIGSTLWSYLPEDPLPPPPGAEDAGEGPSRANSTSLSTAPSVVSLSSPPPSMLAGFISPPPGLASPPPGFVSPPSGPVAAVYSSYPPMGVTSLPPGLIASAVAPLRLATALSETAAAVAPPPPLGPQPLGRAASGIAAAAASASSVAAAAARAVAAPGLPCGLAAAVVTAAPAASAEPASAAPPPPPPPSSSSIAVPSVGSRYGCSASVSFRRALSRMSVPTPGLAIACSPLDGTPPAFGGLGLALPSAFATVTAPLSATSTSVGPSRRSGGGGGGVSSAAPSSSHASQAAPAAPLPPPGPRRLSSRRRGHGAGGGGRVRVIRRSVSLSALPPDAPCPPVFVVERPGGRRGRAHGEEEAAEAEVAEAAEAQEAGGEDRGSSGTGSGRDVSGSASEDGDSGSGSDGGGGGGAQGLVRRPHSRIAAASGLAAPTAPSSNQTHARGPPARTDSSASTFSLASGPTTVRSFIGATSLDYRLIPSAPGGAPITPDTTNALFAAAVEFIAGAVAGARARGLVPVVLTHHAPSLAGTSHPRFAGHPSTHAYGTDLVPYLHGTGIAAWYCGHTHYNFDVRLPCGLRLASNQFGSQPAPAAGYSRSWRQEIAVPEYEPAYASYDSMEFGADVSAIVAQEKLAASYISMQHGGGGLTVKHEEVAVSYDSMEFGADGSCTLQEKPGKVYEYAEVGAEEYGGDDMPYTVSVHIPAPDAALHGPATLTEAAEAEAMGAAGGRVEAALCGMSPTEEALAHLTWGAQPGGDKLPLSAPVGGRAMCQTRSVLASV